MPNASLPKTSRITAVHKKKNFQCHSEGEKHQETTAPPTAVVDYIPLPFDGRSYHRASKHLLVLHQAHGTGMPGILHTQDDRRYRTGSIVLVL